jgi:tRNA A58 N-methylase Trm61
MLAMARISSDDVLYDLGCGDGRFLMTAVTDFGVKKAVGYEIRKDLFATVSEKIRKQGFDNKIKLFNDDLLTADISEATVIMLYLTSTGNERLKPKLTSEAKDGTQIVSHDFSFSEWSPLLREEYLNHTLFLYQLPESLTNRTRVHLSIINKLT